MKERLSNTYKFKLDHHQFTQGCSTPSVMLLQDKGICYHTLDTNIRYNIKSITRMEYIK